MLDQRLAGARDRLHRTGRLLESLDPDAPLKRGYARVSARLNDAVVGSAAVARAAGAVTLHFADGTVDARVERSGERKSVVEGKSVSVRVDVGGRRLSKQKKTQNGTVTCMIQVTETVSQPIVTVYGKTRILSRARSQHQHYE